MPLALFLAALGVWAFVWSVKSGQFEDVETPGMRVLFDEEEIRLGESDPQKLSS